jgi:hypothetical protein
LLWGSRREKDKEKIGKRSFGVWGHLQGKTCTIFCTGFIKI